MIKTFDKSYEVCNCKKIKLQELVDSIRSNNINNLGQIQEYTTAGTECRFCIMKEADFGKIKKSIYLKDVLKEVLNG